MRDRNLSPACSHRLVASSKRPAAITRYPMATEVSVHNALSPTCPCPIQCSHRPSRSDRCCTQRRQLEPSGLACIFRCSCRSSSVTRVLCQSGDLVKATASRCLLRIICRPRHMLHPVLVRESCSQNREARFHEAARCRVLRAPTMRRGVLRRRARLEVAPCRSRCDAIRSSGLLPPSSLLQCH